jgi:hypothetical protein
MTSSGHGLPHLGDKALKCTHGTLLGATFALFWSVVIGCVPIRAQPFTAGSNAPVPLINQPLVPTSAQPGGSSFTLTVNGTGFVSGSVVD